MEKFQLLYITSLIVLGVLLVYTAIIVTQHISPSEKSAVLVEKQELIEPGGKAVVKFKIINRKDRDQLYTYRILVDGSEVYRREVVVPANASYLRPWHFYPTGEGKKRLTS